MHIYILEGIKALRTPIAEMGGRNAREADHMVAALTSIIPYFTSRTPNCVFP